MSRIIKHSYKSLYFYIILYYSYKSYIIIVIKVYIYYVLTEYSTGHLPEVVSFSQSYRAPAVTDVLLLMGALRPSAALGEGVESLAVSRPCSATLPATRDCLELSQCMHVVKGCLH